MQSQIGLCSEFVNNGKKQEVSIVVSPLKVTGIEDMTKGSALKIISGCNMWRACENVKCQFSLVSRPIPRVQKS